MYTVAIIGRPNVGKSAIFNRLVGKRIAIVDSTYGLTRDRISANVSYEGKSFTLIDTGGIDFDLSDDVREKAKRQTELAITQADIVILVADVTEGIVPLDAEVASMLHASGKRVILVANKADNETLALGISEFHKLGFQELFAVSAIHGLGIAPLMKAIASSIPEGVEEGEEDELKIAIVGKRNVGKSTCANSIVREERLVVDELPGTTRDSVDIQITVDGRRITLIDTAGMRHRGKVKESAEYLSIVRSRSSIRRCDIALLIFDALKGVTGQEEKIARYIIDKGKGCVLAANKWDLVKGEGIPRYRKAVWQKMRFLDYAPLIFMSAKFGRGVRKLIQTIFYVQGQINKRIGTPVLNRALHEIWDRNEPPAVRNKRSKFYYATQRAVKPPTFILYVSRRELINRSYSNYLINGLRRGFGFEGTPVHLEFRNRSR